MTQMLLAIDIGNTSATFGLFNKGRLTRRWSIPTGRLLKMRSLPLPHKDDIQKIWACSVVPQASRRLCKLLPKPTHFVTARNIPVIKVTTQKPSEMGADRLVNALAAYKLVGAPSIVVDFGTATTIDVIGKYGRYLGGIIAPGLGLGREALAKKTALLPWLEFDKISRSIRQGKNISSGPLATSLSSIGRNTVQAMSLGLIAGQAALVDEFVTRISRELKTRPKVVATGGYAKLIMPYSRSIKKIDEDLTLKGLDITGSPLSRG